VPEGIKLSPAKSGSEVVEMSQPLIDLKGLTKRFGSGDGILAVNDLSFSVSAGEVLGFLGPNGAGKSTTMKMITGYLAPTKGSVIICGHDVSLQPIEAKRRIGYLPEGAPLYAEMTPLSFLNFIADTRGLSGAEKEKAVKRAVERTSLGGVLHQPVDTLSKGFKRRVGLAQAILHEPAVLILDEPTDGLDPNQKHEVRQLIREMAAQSGKAIVLSTHILEEVEAVCTRAIIIAKGKIVTDSTPTELMSRSRFHNALTLTLTPPAGAMVFDDLSKISGVKEVIDRGRTQSGDGVKVSCTLVAEKGRDVADAAARLCREKSWRVDAMHTETGRLEDVFRELTGSGSKV